MYDTKVSVDGSLVGVERAFTAVDTGFDAISVKAVASVVGNVLDLQGFSDFLITINIVRTAGTNATGLMNLILDCFDEAGNTLLSAYPVVTAINIKDSNVYTLAFGRTNTAKQYYTSGTPLLDASADILRIPARMRITLTTTEIGSGTTNVATVYVRAGS